MKFALEIYEVDFLMHCLCKYLHDHWGFNVVPALLAYTNGGHRFCVSGKVKGVKDKLILASGGHCCPLRGRTEVCLVAPADGGSCFCFCNSEIGGSIQDSNKHS